MEITIRHTPGCPNAEVARQRVTEALRAAGIDHAAIRLELVADDAAAQRIGFCGSPTVLIDGDDPFAEPGAPPAFACRIYATPEGRDFAPSVALLSEALERQQV